jgi:transposase
MTGVSLSEIRRIEAEDPVENYDDAAERRRRGIGRPSKAEPLRAFVLDRLAQSPRLSSLDLLRGAKFAKGGLHRVHFFVSQLSYSRWSEVSMVPDREMESLLRALIEHFARMGGVPLVAVFDRHNAAAIATNVDGGGGPWHPAFAQSILDLGIGVDLRGRGREERSGGSVEKLVRWVKASFFATRRFADAPELQDRLDEWILDVNTRSTARGTGVVPQARMTEERVRLRPVAVHPDQFAPRIPVIVGPGAEVVFDGVSYPMPTETVGRRAMLYLHSGRVRIVGAGFDIEHERVRVPPGSEFSE